MKVHILTAEQFSVPGIITKAFADLAGAEALNALSRLRGGANG